MHAETTSVRNWLRGLNLEGFAELFEDNLIDEEALLELTEADLVELGLPLGPRVKIRAALERARAKGLGELQQSEGADESAHHEGAERRRLTVMFVDLVGSTAMQTRLDPEDMAEVIRAYQETCSEVITRFDGHVAKYMGDGVLAYFGWPRTHEDEVAQAVRAGLAIADAVTTMASPEPDPLRARVGLATGLVVVGDLVGEEESKERAVVGETPNLAARLQAEAEPGQVVISEGTWALLGGQFDFHSLGDLVLKGFIEPIRGYSVLSERAIESRFEARHESLLPIIGREHELALIMDRWERAAAGEGQGVVVVGDAGIGKSRIVRAVLDGLSDSPHVSVRYQCSPNHTDSALWPVTRQLSFAGHIEVGDDTATKRAKLATVLAKDEGSADDVQTLGRLIGLETPASESLDAAVERSRTMEALVRQLLLLSETAPVLVVLEDAHWSDPTTLEMIERFLVAISGARVMVLLTSRPDQQRQLDAHPHVSRVALNRLGRVGVEEIVRELSPGADFPPELIDDIVARTDGVPLFAEELTKTVLETGSTEVPATLHDSLMARLDRIGEVKEIAQVASCIGREFEYRLLSAIADVGDGALKNSLEKLGAAGLVFGRGTPPDARYIFKHTLLQDTAYESLLKTKRRATHARIADVLEHQLRDLAEAEPEVVAFHLTQAELFERAVPFWEKAGRRSVERSANTEAIGHLSEALNATQELPESAQRSRSELGIYAEMAGPLMSAKGYNAADTVEVFGHIQRLIDEVGDNALMFPALYQQWLGPIITGAADEALKTAEKFVELAAAEDDPAMTFMGQRLLGISLFEQGHPARAVETLKTVKELYNADEHEAMRFRYGQDPFAAAMSLQSLGLFALGLFDQATSAVSEAKERAIQVNHANTLGYTLTLGELTLAWCLDDRSRVGAASEEAYSLSDQFGMVLWRGYTRVFQGWHIVVEQGTANGLDIIGSGFDDLDATRTGLHRRQLMVMHAEAMGHLGKHDEGIKIIAQAFDLPQEEWWVEPDMHRVRGTLLLGAGRIDESVEAFNVALETARKQGAPGWELRTAINMAEVMKEVGEVSTAADLLENAYSQIGEGPNQPIMLRAHKLLQDLT